LWIKLFLFTSSFLATFRKNNNFLYLKMNYKFLKLIEIQPSPSPLQPKQIQLYRTYKKKQYHYEVQEKNMEIQIQAKKPPRHTYTRNYPQMSDT